MLSTMMKNARLALFCTLIFSFSGIGQETTTKAVATTAMAADLWKKMNAGPYHVHESKKIILAVPKSMESKARDIAANLEKHQEAAMKPMGFDEETPPWAGKILVFILPEREQFAGFVRKVEKRSPMKEENSSFGYLESIPHLAATAAKGKEPVPAEVEASVEISAAVLRSRAGQKTPLPDWIPDGFGRAVRWKVLGGNNKSVQVARRKVLLASKNVKGLGDLWNYSDTEIGPLLQASLMEYLTFGPQAAKVTSFVKAFSPDDNGDSKSPEQALEAAMIIPGQIVASWRSWVPGQK